MVIRNMRPFQRSDESGSVSSLAGWVLAAVTVLLLVGCASTPDIEIPEHIHAPTFAPELPLFLRAPVAAAFTNTASYSAHIEAQGASILPQKIVAGEIFQQKGFLLFAAVPEKIGDKKHPIEPGFGFLWNVGEQKGWLLSEALQAYAPVSAMAAASNLVAAPMTQEERIDGHPCRGESWRATNGGTGFVVWRASDLDGIPLRIEGTIDSTSFHLNLSKVRVQQLGNDVFKIPEGFTKYNSAEALVDELAARQHHLHYPGLHAAEPFGLDNPTPGAQRPPR
jgi:hypothetical protein